MATVTLKLSKIAPYMRERVKKTVKEASVDLRNRLVGYSPVGQYPGGGTFKSNWQPPVYGDGGFTARVVNTTQNYGLAITFGGRYMPPSWNNEFKSNFGLPERWPIVLAAKETQELVPSMWKSAGS